MLIEALDVDQTLHGAADRMHMTQPNATRLLAELEHMLGARLYERTSRGLLATPYGQAMTAHARLLLFNLDQVDGAVQSLLDGTAGLVRIGTMASISPSHLITALGTTIAGSDSVRISIVEGAHDMLADRLRHGELDLVVGRVRPDTVLDGLQVQTLAEEEFTVVCGVSHALASRRRIDFSDVVDMAWVLPPPAVPVRQGLDALFTSRCGRIPHRIVESVSLFTNLYLLRSAQLLGIAPALVAADLQDEGLLRCLPMPLTGIVGPVVLIVRDGGILNGSAARVVSALRDSASVLKQAAE